MLEDNDRHDAIIYFGRHIKRSEFIAEVDRWSRTFRGMGIREDERVLLYAPFTPEIAYMIMALNQIGATVVMLNLTASREALKRSATGTNVAIVIDVLEEQIAHVLRDADVFPQVILVDAATCMPQPLRAMAGLATWYKRHKILSQAPNYMTTREALRRFSDYEGEIEVPYRQERIAFVTSSAGTSKDGYAKQVMDTNETVLYMFQQLLPVTALTSRYATGNTTYLSFPPFVSTSFFTLFMVPLMRNMTCIIEPRGGVEPFAQGVIKYRPNIVVATGKCWEHFCLYLEEEAKKGKTIDLSFLRFAVMGGEGCTPKELDNINEKLEKYGSPDRIASGYGMSETFSVMSVEIDNLGIEHRQSLKKDRQVNSVGIPLPGVTVGIFDKEGNELPYGERGELRVQSTTMFHGYYNDAELHKKTVVDGWLHTGDLCTLDTDGNIYHYCRLSDSITFNGHDIYPIDLEIKLQEHESVKACIVVNVPNADNLPHLKAHIIFEDDVTEDRMDLLKVYDAWLDELLPDGVHIEGYKIHSENFGVSITGKIDRNKYRRETEGFVTVK